MSGSIFPRTPLACFSITDDLGVDFNVFCLIGWFCGGVFFFLLCSVFVSRNCEHMLEVVKIPLGDLLAFFPIAFQSVM